MRPLHTIAAEIAANWLKINPHARPYLDAMRALSSINERYFYDSARAVVLGFLVNANTWRGPVARRIKAELHDQIQSPVLDL